MGHRLRILAVLTVLHVCFAGCSDRAKPGSKEAQGKPFLGQQLEIAVPAGLGFQKAWQIVLDEWSARTGGSYRIHEYELKPHGQPLAELLGRGADGSAESEAALFVFPITRIAELADAGLLATVNESQRTADSLDWLDLFQGLRENVASFGRKKRPTVLPLSCPVMICYYRRDLLEQADLSVPQTWAEHQKLLEMLDRWAPGMTAVEPWGELFRATMFLSRAVSYAKHPGNYSLFFDIASGEPLIDSPAFLRALKETKQALEKMPAEVKSYSPADCRREFFAGKAALAIAFETGAGNPLLPFGPGGSGSGASAHEADAAVIGRRGSMKIAFSRLPGVREVYNASTLSWERPPDGRINHTTLTAFGGLCAGVSSNSSPLQAQAGWNLLATLAIGNLRNAFPGATKSPCRDSQIADAPLWVGGELSAVESRAYVNAVAESLGDMRLVAELPVVGRELFRSALSAGIDQVFSGAKTPQQALETVAAEWREITSRIGVAKLTNSYRRSLGLSPRRRSK